MHSLVDSFCFFKDFIYFQREEKGGRKRGRDTSMCEINIDWLPLSHPHVGTWPLGMCLDGEWNLRPSQASANPLSHTSQGFWLLLVCALSGDGTHNLGVSGQCSH